MNQTRNTRLLLVKAALWLIVGVATVVGAARYALGLGLTTALSDLTPWGMWIGFDVMAGVALAAGGFVIAATVHVFHLERYHALLRPAVLTAFLGYVAVVVGLLADLGRPWNIWRPTIFWQPDSALFEVAWCVMLYLTVLALEFAPVVFEGLKWSKAFRFMTRLTLPLVALGIALSTLHQSSLGTLLVIAPERVHPLWYSPILPPLFFLSAIGLGLAMVTVENITSAWLYRREAEWPQIGGLTRAASVVLGLYLVVRIGDLVARGSFHHAFSSSWAAALFWLEIGIAGALPMLLFSLPAARRSRIATGWGAWLAVGGFVLNRAATGGISHVSRTGELYLPALTEVAVSLGVVSAMALIFLFLVENFPVFEHAPETPDHFRRATVEPASRVRVRGPWLGAGRRAGLAWVIGALIGAVLIEAEVAHRSTPRPTPIAAPRAVSIERGEAATPLRHLAVVAAPDPGAPAQRALLIDGDRSNRAALFEHEAHQKRLGGDGSCIRCHHANAPLARGTSCAACHRDMYQPTDTFDHARHVGALEGNRSCARCHPEGGDRTRARAAACTSCHKTWRKAPGTEEIALTGVAAGYRKAMHELCIGCHRTEDTRRAASTPVLSRCDACHRERDESSGLTHARTAWLLPQGAS